MVLGRLTHQKRMWHSLLMQARAPPESGAFQPYSASSVLW
jgi:hypothetical protein